MKFEQVKVGAFYVTTANIGASKSHGYMTVAVAHNGAPTHIPKGTTLKAIKLQPRGTQYYAKPDFSSTLMEWVGTGHKYSICVHRHIDEYIGPVPTEDTPKRRQREAIVLSTQIKTWKKELALLDTQRDLLREKIVEADNRLENLKRFDSDEEALLDLIKSRTKEGLTLDNIGDLLREQGITL